MLPTQSSQGGFKADFALFQNVLAFFWGYRTGLRGGGGGGGARVIDKVKSKTEGRKVRDAS